MWRKYALLKWMILGFQVFIPITAKSLFKRKQPTYQFDFIIQIYRSSAKVTLYIYLKHIKWTCWTYEEGYLQINDFICTEIPIYNTFCNVPTLGVEIDFWFVHLIVICAHGTQIMITHIHCKYFGIFTLQFCTSRYT